MRFFIKIHIKGMMEVGETIFDIYSKFQIENSVNHPRRRWEP